MKKRYNYEFKRTCKLCGEVQILKATPRADRCRKCVMTKVGIRTGTGKAEIYHAQGYQMLTVNKETVYAHRYLMEVRLGRKLSRKEHVHHIDGNKRNNAIENLELLSASDHAKEHMTPEIAKARSVLAHEAKRKMKGT